ncbi:hypothetical protein K438DRAFT_1748398 [Mycena galopus ATCC 62051]|nr:hypothetical protein K438DRAFT_1748398 [Mycena galopus ATCC 62051]
MFDVGKMLSEDSQMTDLVMQPGEDVLDAELANQVAEEKEARTTQNNVILDELAKAAQNQELIKQLEASNLENEAQQKKAKEMEHVATDKANEAAALCAKLANQAAGQTPRTHQKRTMGDVQIRHMAAAVPVIPFIPIQYGTTAAAAGWNPGPTAAAAGSGVGSEANLVKLAAAVAQLLPGGKVVSPKTMTRNPVSANELKWKASLS